MSRQNPTKVSELPSDAFYAILYPESTTIPGDERSRTNPGHGYPEHSVDYWRMEVFSTREEWLAEIERLSKAKGVYSYTEFRAVRITPAKITTSVNVVVDD